MVEPVVRFKKQTFYPTIEPGTQAEEVLRKYLDSFVIVAGTVTGLEGTQRQGRNVVYIDVQRPLVVQHYDPALTFMMVPASDDLGTETATFQVSRAEGLKVGATVTLPCLIFPNKHNRDLICVAHDSSTLSPESVFRKSIKQLLVDAEMVGWKGDQLTAALQKFEKTVYTTLAMPFLDTTGTKLRMKMAAIKTKKQLLIMKDRVERISRLCTEAKNSDGTVDVPHFTKAAFEMQDDAGKMEGFYEVVIRGKSNEELKKLQYIKPLFEINKTNALEVLEATKEQVLLMQEQSDDEFEPDGEDELLTTA